MFDENTRAAGPAGSADPTPEATTTVTPTPGPTVTEVRAEASRLATQVGGPIRRVAIRHGDIAVEVEWEHPVGTFVPAAAAAPEPAAAPPEDDGRQLVLSPMVGTYYHSPAPEEPPFVAVGDPVSAGQVVGIVEAMKLMNPIVAEVDGTVAEILTDNGRPVEFGDGLVAIVPR